MFVEGENKKSQGPHVCLWHLVGTGKARAAALLAPRGALNGLVLTALTLLMRDVLSKAKTLVADEEMVGKCVRLVRWQKAVRLIQDELTGKVVINLCHRPRIFAFLVLREIKFSLLLVL